MAPFTCQRLQTDRDRHLSGAQYTIHFKWYPWRRILCIIAAVSGWQNLLFLPFEKNSRALEDKLVIRSKKETVNLMNSKTVLMALASLLLVASLTACGPGGGGGETKPADSGAATDTPATDAGGGDAPASTGTDAPAGDKPAGDAPAADAPAGDKPAGDAPAADAPAGDKPAGDAPAAGGDAGEGGE